MAANGMMRYGLAAVFPLFIVQSQCPTFLCEPLVLTFSQCTPDSALAGLQACLALSRFCYFPSLLCSSNGVPAFVNEASMAQIRYDGRNQASQHCI